MVRRNVERMNILRVNDAMRSELATFP
jgi:hypothetical protein